MTAKIELIPSKKLWRATIELPVSEYLEGGVQMPASSDPKIVLQFLTQELEAIENPKKGVSA